MTDRRHPRRPLRRALATLALATPLTLAACTGAPVPRIDAVTPAFGAAASQATVEGAGFSADAVVTVGGTEAVVLGVVDTFGRPVGGSSAAGRRIAFVVPLLNEGPRDVTVTQASGSDTLEDGFTYVLPLPEVQLELADLAPASGGAGTTVVLAGTDLMGSASVTVCGELATVVVVRDGVGNAIIPQATNGASVEFVVPDLRADLLCDVVVTQPSGSATLVDAFTFAAPDPAPLRVNAGGPAFTTGGGVDFAADVGFVAGLPESNPTGLAPDAIAGTDDDGLYLTYRRAVDAAPFGYALAAPKIGTYTVTLHFAELFWGVPGGAPDNDELGNRVFDVVLEGTTVLDDFDLRAAADPATAVTRAFEVFVEDGTLDVEVVTSAGNGLVSAIEVVFGTP